MFVDLIMFDTLKYVALGDEDTRVEILGQGLLDYIVNGSYRVQAHGYLVASGKMSKMLQAASDYLRYEGCEVFGKCIQFQILYLSFSFIIPTSTFKYDIAPGKYSHLLVMWMLIV
jgi:hypothetical protein